jgi:hypothetical protein
MIAIEISAPQLARLTKAVGDAKKSLPKEISAAINATSKKTRLDIGRDIRKQVNIKKPAVDSVLKLVKQSTAQTLTAQVSLLESDRLPLREFGARQTKAGVSYKISKQGKRGTIQSAFIVRSIGNHVFRRTGVFGKASKGRYQGMRREKIKKLFGPSPWGVFTKRKMAPAQRKAIEAELAKQIERRINLNVLRANGLVQT